jgi:3-hydroxymyristoyl/3-hydroxydecanoyl-(acyl carrier protein) dehydratase
MWNLKKIGKSDFPIQMIDRRLNPDNNRLIAIKTVGYNLWNGC